MKFISVKKLKDLMNHCTERDEFLIDQDDLVKLLDEFGDDYHVSEFNYSEPKLTNKSKKDYNNGWKFTYP